MRHLRKLVVASLLATAAIVGLAQPASARVIYSGGCIDYGGGGCRTYQWCNFNTVTRSGSCVDSGGGRFDYQVPNIAYDVS